jgi:hypothetical protein
VTTTAGDTDVSVLETGYTHSLRCELWWQNVQSGREYRCDRPAEVRLRVRCDRCGKIRVNFYCGPCRDEIERGKTKCASCGASVRVLGEA